jgi:hypothetical protein
MEFKSGDRVQVEYQSPERPPRTGVVEEVVRSIVRNPISTSIMASASTPRVVALLDKCAGPSVLPGVGRADRFLDRGNSRD